MLLIPLAIDIIDLSGVQDGLFLEHHGRVKVLRLHAIELTLSVGDGDAGLHASLQTSHDALLT